MTLLEGLDLWKNLNSRSPRTEYSYRAHLAALADFGLDEVDRVSVQALAAYISVRRQAGVKPQSINQALAAVFASLGALASIERYPREQLERLKRLRLKVRLPRRYTAIFLERTQYDALIARARALEPRVVLPIQIAALAGLRVGELAKLRREDIDLDARPAIRVRVIPELGASGLVKSGSERAVPVCSELRALLLAAALPEHGYLFPARPPSGLGRPPLRPCISVKTLGHELRRVRLSAIETWQVLRHTRASAWAIAGAPLAKISLWLGHSGVEVTERFYAALREGYDPDCERTPA